MTTSKSNLINNTISFSLFISFAFFVLSFSLAFAQATAISKVRVTYRPDGGVSITSFVAGVCESGEAETECMDREMQKNPSLANLPHDDILPSELPQDRKDRDKWRGSKGQGIQIDHTLVTKNEKLEELQEELDKELDKNSSNSVKIAKLQRKIEKLRDFQAPQNLIPQEKLNDFDLNENQSFLASVVETVTGTVSSAFSSLLTSIQNGFLALKQLVTDTLKVGTPEKPAGITVYDQTTKQPFCVIVKDSQLQSIPGECQATSVIPDTDPESSNTTASLGEQPPPQDVIAPIITLNGPSTIEIEIGTAWVDPGATVTDNVNDNLGIYYSVDGVPTGNQGNDLPQSVIDTSVSGSHTITYSSTDQAGNIGTTNRTLTVIESTAPTATSTPQ